MVNIQGKIAVITGASSGIGKATAQSLAREKSGLILISQNESRLKKMKDELLKLTHPIYTIPADLSKTKEINACIDTIVKYKQSIDFLIHSAGIIKLNTFENARAQDLDEQFYVNTRAPYLLTQGLLPQLKKTKGNIIFLNSSAAYVPNTYNGQYAATKAALKSIADSIRQEVNDYGIHVTSLHAGSTNTPMQDKVLKYQNRSAPQKNLIQPENIAQSILSVLQMNHTAQITDIVIKTAKK